MRRDCARSLRYVVATDLSRREKEVLKALSRGNSTTEIGDLLGISKSSVDKYRRRIGRKFGLSGANMSQLARLAVLSSEDRERHVIDVEAPLSEREKQVLALLGEGKPTKQIARELRLSLKTVQLFCGQAKLKLRAKTFYHLLVIAVLWREGKLRLRKQYEWRYQL